MSTVFSGSNKKRNVIIQWAMPAIVRTITPQLVEKVIKALEMYAEGGTKKAHLDALNMRHGDFYAVLRAHPELDQIYKDIQRDRADMMVDESYQLGTDEMPDPRVARVRAEIRMKIAGMYDRKRFGEKVDLTIENRVDLRAVIAGVEARALPWRDLSPVVDAQVEAISTHSLPPPADTPSVAPPAEDAERRRQALLDD
jgi:hypothetical protein